MMARGGFNWPNSGWQNPFVQLEQKRRNMAQLTGALLGGPEQPLISHGVFPSVNILEDRQNYYLRAELPGMKSEEIDLQITGRNVSITGERKIVHLPLAEPKKQ